MKKRLVEGWLIAVVVMFVAVSLVNPLKVYGEDYKVYFLEPLRYTKVPTTIQTLETRFPEFVAWPFGFVYIEGSSKKILVDCGVDEEAIKAKVDPATDVFKVEKYASPVELLGRLNVKPDEITDIILTHLHWDHASGMDYFPKAVLHLQKKEIQAAVVSPEFKFMANHYRFADIQKFLKRAFDGRARYLDGDQEVFDGVNVYFTPGHTFGNQAVTVKTGGVLVTILGDTSHALKNLINEMPDVHVVDVPAMLQSFRKIKSLAGFDTNYLVGSHFIENTIKYPQVADHVYRIK